MVALRLAGVDGVLAAASHGRSRVSSRRSSTSFSPLQDEALKERVEALLARCGFASKGVFVMDGSRRSSHGNAYFTGVGRNKRIVFFDTLLERLGATEVEAVLAHELGHFRLQHVRQRLVLSLVASLIALAALAWLVRQPAVLRGARRRRRRLRTQRCCSSMFVVPAFTYFITPLGALVVAPARVPGG